MDKKFILVVLIMFIANIIVTALLVSTVLTIQSPNVSIEIKAVGINEHTISFEVNMQVDNPNSFSILLEDMLINITTPNGNPIGSIMLPNMTISSGQHTTISSINTMGFNNSTLTTFHSRITGNVGVTLFGFFTKRLSINVLLITNPTALVEAVQLPSIHFDANFSEFTTEGLMFNGTLLIENQNDFSLSLSDLEIRMEHTNAHNIADFSTTEINIPPNSIVPTYINGTANYTIFNQGKLSATIQGNASLLIAGINMSLPFTSTTATTVPDLSTFLLNGEHLIISLSADIDVTLQGLNATVGFRLYNPTKIPMTAFNLTLLMYRLDNATPTLLAEDILEQCSISPVNETCLISNFLLPYTSLLPKIGTGLPEWFQLSLSGDFTIANTTQRIPVTINGYVSPRLFNFT